MGSRAMRDRAPVSPRPQPYGLSIGRGQFVRGRGPRHARRPGGVETVVELVGFTKATTPPSGVNNQGGDELIIPLPSGTQSGDVAIAIAAFLPTSIPVPTSPSGWIRIFNGGGGRYIVDTRTFDGTEDPEYTWTDSQLGWSKSGCMIVVRNAVSLLGGGQSTSLSVPTITIGVENVFIIALSCCQFGSSPTETYAVTGGLTELTEHASRGNRPYINSEASCVAMEFNPPIGSYSGRAFTHPSVVAAETFMVALGT